jgi:hypothetical protein
MKSHINHLARKCLGRTLVLAVNFKHLNALMDMVMVLNRLPRSKQNNKMIIMKKKMDLKMGIIVKL